MNHKILVIITLVLCVHGFATAEITSLTLEKNLTVSGQDSIGINVTANQTTDDVYVILDNNTDTNYTSSTDLMVQGSISLADTSQRIGNFSATDTSSIVEGVYTVYGVQQPSEPLDGENLTGQINTTLEFDNTAPNITEYKLENNNLSFVSDEELEGALISISSSDGAIDDTIGLENLSSNSSSGDIIYWYTAEVDSDTEITFSLDYAGDAAGNDGSSGQEDSLTLNPIVSDFDLVAGTYHPQVEISSFDQLNTINVSLGGNASGYLGESDFSESSEGSTYNYTANITYDGKINATLLEAVNSTGYDGAWKQEAEKTFQFPPQIVKFYLDSSGQEVDLYVDVSESLAELNATYGGTVSEGNLTFSDFTESTEYGYYNYTANIPSGMDGIYNASLDFAEDDSGEQNTAPFTDEITVDTVAPTISEFNVTNPESGILEISFNSSEELDVITVSGSGVETFTMTENNFSTFQNEAPYMYNGSYTISGEGDETVTLEEAKDSVGNDGSSGESKTLTVEYPPTIHEFDLYADGQDVNVSINSSEQLNDMTVELGEDVSGTLGSTDFTLNSSDPYVYIANVSSGTEGTFNASLEAAVDQQGLDGSSGEEDLLIIDNTPPPNPEETNILDDPVTEDNVDSVSVEINFSSETETGDLEVRFKDSEGASTVKTKTVGSTDKVQTFDFDISDIAEGDFQADSRILDEAGNVNSEGFTASSSTVTKDTSPPEVVEAITGDSLTGESTDTDSLKVEFSDNIAGVDDSSIDASDFTVSAEESVSVDSISVNQGTATLSLSRALSTGEKPNLQIFGVSDDYGNDIDVAEQVIANDGLRPYIVSASVDHASSNETDTWIELEFSESMTLDNGDITVDGKTVTGDTGSLSTTHAISYGELLETGNSPTITSVSGIDDLNGNSAYIEGDGVNVSSFRKDLSQGMNTVSFPIEDGNTYPISDLLPTEKIDVVWAYYDGEWKAYNPNSSNNDFTDIKGGYGYMVKASEDFTIAPNIDILSGSSEAEYPVDEGWNLVGQMQEYEQTADTSDAFAGLASGTTEEVHKLEYPDSLGYKRIDPDSSDPEKMEPGNAYWVKATESDTLLTPSFATSPSGIVVDFLKAIGGFFQSIYSFFAGVIA